MLGIDFAKSVTEMSLSHLRDPPAYTAARRAHDFMQSSEQSHPNGIVENKAQQHSINDILSSSNNKQGKYFTCHIQIKLFTTITLIVAVAFIWNLDIKIELEAAS